MIKEIAKQSSNNVQRKRKTCNKNLNYVSSQDPEVLTNLSRRSKPNLTSNVEDISVDLGSPVTKSMGLADLVRHPSDTTDIQNLGRLYSSSLDFQSQRLNSNIKRKQDKSKIQKRKPKEPEEYDKIGQFGFPRRIEEQIFNQRPFLNGVKKNIMVRSKKTESKTTKKQSKLSSSLSKIFNQSIQVADQRQENLTVKSDKNVAPIISSKISESKLSTIQEEQQNLYQSDAEMKSPDEQKKKVMVLNSPNKSEDKPKDIPDEFEF